MSSSAIKYLRASDERVAWQRCIPFFLVHLMPLGILFTGIRLRDVILCFALYYGRMFFITAGYHRYFAHRTFKTSRFFQFLLALGGATSAQKGVLWWASHHRNHHKFSDQPEDVHSPRKGFWWSHIGWILCTKYESRVKINDFSKYPELRWLDRYHLVPPTVLGAIVFLLGGAPALFGGFFLSTVLLYHGTFVINSLTHVWGSRRYVTSDTSRNNFLLALITNGEGWHNNHHYYQSSANQGFFWWEIDVSYYLLKLLSAFRLVWDLRTPSKKVIASNRVKQSEAAAAPAPAASIAPAPVSVEAV
jgi:stearoyl-CoA desaturase (Delta-9 desaturase)